MYRLTYYFTSVCVGMMIGYFVNSAIAHGMGPMGHGMLPPRPPPLDSFVKELGLTETQVADIRKIQSKNGPSNEALHRTARERQLKFEDLLFDGGDRATVEEAFQRFQQAKTAAENANFNMMVEVHGLLTKGQLSKLKALRGNEGSMHDPR